jgi:tryptophanyl-tRNA synthetase
LSLILSAFADPKSLRKQVMRIVTDSSRPEDPKHPDDCNVFRIYKYFASDDAIASRRNAYLKGGLGYSEIKQELYDLLNEFFGARRQAYQHLLDDKDHLDRVLGQGAEKARAVAGPMLERVCRAIGIRR